MGIEVKSNINFKRTGSALVEGARTALARETEKIVGEIHSRTLSGKDANGKAFPAYSAEYAAAKASGDAKRLNKLSGKAKKAQVKRARTGRLQKPRTKKSSSSFAGGGRVNLTLFGTMLGNMTSQVKMLKSGVEARIYFSSAKQAQKAKQHMTGTYFGKKTGKVRKFFALSASQEKRIRSLMTELFNRIITQGK